MTAFSLESRWSVAGACRRSASAPGSSGGAACETAVRLALELGYRHVDTAEMYGNEAEVGAALAASGVDRDTVFLTTKIWSDHLHARDVRHAAEASLRRLGTDYVDLLLIHWPNEAVPLAETLGAMAELAGEGKTRAIGVSNFPPDLLARAIAASPLPLAADQVEFHVRRPQQALHQAARAAGIAVTAYSPLAKGRLARDPALLEVARRHGRTPAQVALRWLIEQDGVAAIPKASGPANLRANLEIFDFSLDDDDRRRLA
jgi:2,5-diketo-D-gluconate reductase B